MASVDIETTGLDPNIHQITEIAIVYGDIDKPKDVQRIHLSIWPEDFVWSTFCLNLHKDYLARVISAQQAMQAKTMDDPVGFTYIREVAAKIRNFLWDCQMPGKCLTTQPIPKSTPAGKNFGSFDLQFIKNRYPEVASLFRHRGIDPGALYLHADDKVPPELALCKDRAIAEGAKLKPGVAHNALADAEDVWDLFHWNSQGDSETLLPPSA